MQVKAKLIEVGQVIMPPESGTPRTVTKIHKAARMLTFTFETGEMTSLGLEKQVVLCTDLEPTTALMVHPTEQVPLPPGTPAPDVQEQVQESIQRMASARNLTTSELLEQLKPTAATVGEGAGETVAQIVEQAGQGGYVITGQTDVTAEELPGVTMPAAAPAPPSPPGEMPGELVMSVSARDGSVVRYRETPDGTLTATQFPPGTAEIHPSNKAGDALRAQAAASDPVLEEAPAPELSFVEFTLQRTLAAVQVVTGRKAAVQLHSNPPPVDQAELMRLLSLATRTIEYDLAGWRLDYSATWEQHKVTDAVVVYRRPIHPVPDPTTEATNE